MIESPQTTKKHISWLASILVLLILTVIATSYYYFQQTKDNLVADKYQEIKTLTSQKATRVSYWIDERKAEGIYLATNNVLHEALEDYSFLRNNEEYHRIEELFEQLRKNHDYTSIAFLDTSGVPVLTTGAAIEAPVPTNLLSSADTSKSPFLIQDELSAIIPSPVILTPVVSKRRSILGYIYQKIDIRNDIRPIIEGDLVNRANLTIKLIYLKNDQLSFIPDSIGVTYEKDQTTDGTIPNQIFTLASQKRDGELIGYGFDRLLKLGHLSRVNGYDLYIYSSASLEKVEEPLTPIFILLTIIIIFTIVVASLGGLLIVKSRESKYIENIAESEAFLESIREGMSDGFIVFDDDLTILAVNGKAISVFGKERNEIVGKNASDLLPQLKESSFYHSFVEVRRLRKPLQSIDYYEPWDIFFQNKFFPVLNGIALFFSDITEEMKLKEALRTTNQQLEGLTLHLQVVTENEREAIAREIHDELGQALTSLKMNLAMMRNSINANPRKMDSNFILDEMASMGKQIDDTVKRIRRIITELRPEVLDHLGLIAAIEWLIDESSGKGGIKYEMIKNVDELELDKVTATALFRMVQESITNINRHSQATEAKIEIHFDDPGLTISVADNGIGFSQKADGNLKSFGLAGMKERAKLIHANISINSVKKSGTKIVIKVDQLKKN